MPNRCGRGCTPKTCAQLAKNCGRVDDGCGTPLDCGMCSGTTQCGAGGIANVCAPVCAGCPMGFSCNAMSACAGGNLGNLVLDVPVPPQHTISGRVTKNGMDPGATLCSTSTRAQLTFTNVADSRFNASTTVAGCAATTDPYTFNVDLYPGTYRVTVDRGTSGGSTLPTWSTVANPAFVVSAPATNVVFDVPVPPQHMVSGRVTKNGADPGATLCSTSTRAQLTFTNMADPRFNASTTVAGCAATTDPYTFSVLLYPGTYRVTVDRGTSGGSTLPSWTTVANPAFLVSGPATNVVFDVPVPPQHTVSGRVTKNGMDPGATLCSTSTRAQLTFTNSADARFNASTTVAGCAATTDPYTFSVDLYPGTYRVTVDRGTSGGSTLPTWSTVANPAFVVSAPATNVVFDVPVPPQHTVSGRVTKNGADPGATLCSTSTRAELQFTHLTDSRFNATTTVPGCSMTTDPYTFTIALYPGVYRVTVSRGTSGGSTLPSWSTVVVPRLQVP